MEASAHRVDRVDMAAEQEAGKKHIAQSKGQEFSWPFLFLEVYFFSFQITTTETSFQIGEVAHKLNEIKLFSLKNSQSYTFP